MPRPLVALEIPEALATAATSMAPSYLRRRLGRVGSPYASGDTTTFAYVGDAEAVRAVHFMARFPEIPPLQRFSDTELWYVTVELPRRCRVEYKLDVTGKERVDRILDPLNRRTATDPFGANSVAFGPGYVEPAWVSPGVDARLGTMEVIEIGSGVFGDARTVSVYLPDAYPDQGPYPTVYLHDGSDLIEHASITTVLDNLIGAGAVPPMVAVLLDPVDRDREYADLPEHTRFLVDELMPHIAAEMDVSPHPHDRMLGGASLGAIATLAAAWRSPGTFGSLILLSGSFVTTLGGPWQRGPIFIPVIEFMERFAGAPGRPADRVWMACGEYEALVDDDRAMVPLLESTGMAVHYEEPRDGHHWHNWRTNLGNALRALSRGRPAAPPGGPRSTRGE